MYFVEDIEKRQCEIKEVAVKERGVYLFRFRADRDIKWAHARVDEINEDNIVLRTWEGRPAIAVCIGDVLEVHSGEAQVEKLDEDIMWGLVLGAVYSENTKKF